MKLKKKTTAPTWEVAVVAATREGAEAHYFDIGRANSTPVAGEVAVRLLYNGASRLTFGTAKITADDFEDRVTTLKAGAEERAAALTAVGAR